MALGAKVSKAELNVIDLDRHYYHNHSLILAQHPSETNERLMLRLLVFALHAHDMLSFTKGLSTDDEPDLWKKSLADEIELWIELGLPSEKRLKKACGRANQVIVYAYGGGSAEQWWKQMEAPLKRFSNLSIFSIDESTIKKIVMCFDRKIDVQVTIQDSEITWDGNDNASYFRIERLR